ncbi:hypothetical protein [Luteimonas sp. YGD11-2]|uniref:hypothetical protein n=1 Tax=Luteimonas sp. YGD11-2 TaxID=2508168 RepID=UPI00100B7EAF|nr:hypothetical protein [Luteimonas sp. YGD11-2]
MKLNALTKMTAFLALAVLLASCARREADTDADGDQTATASSADQTVPAQVANSPAGPPPEVTGVKIEVTLPPDAEQALASAGEKVRVEVILGGDPAPGSSAPTNEFGLVELLKDVHELDGSGTLQFAEEDVDQSRLDEIVGQPQLMVNAMSAMKSSSTNMLACAFYWDTLSKAGREGVRIECPLTK